MQAPLIHERLAALSRFLATHRALWEPRPFLQRPLPWEAEHPEVARWLRGQSAAQVEALSAPHTLRIGAPVALQRWIDEAAALCAVPELPRQPAPLSGHRAWRVPARKRAQIEAFSGVVAALFPRRVEALVEWCAGKGHLGRALAAALGTPVLGLEQRPALCAEGRRLARRAGVDCTLAAVDVLAGGAEEHLRPERGAVGLHACGELGVALLRGAVARGAAAVALAPCCHHRIGARARYAPLSAAGRAGDLGLDQVGLRLLAAEEVVARAGVRDARRREMAFRLGLDLLLREASGAAQYRHQAPLPAAWVRLPFAEFCRRVAAARGLTLPGRWDADATETEARRLLAVAQALGRVRLVFRRPLELWLVLDLASYLAEHGLTVALGTFCPERVTPRNLMLIGLRGGSAW